MSEVEPKVWPMPDIVLIAHGSPDPRYAADVELLADAVRDRVRRGRAVGTCFLNYSPSPDEIAAELRRRAVAVPILLSPEKPGAPTLPGAVRRLASHGTIVRLAPGLGPDGRLIDACEELLVRAGVAPDKSTGVLALVAHSDEVNAVDRMLRGAPRRRWGGWAVAALDEPDAVEEATARLRESVSDVVGVPFTMARCLDRDHMAVRCASLGVRLMPGSLAQTSALADLVVARTG